MGLLDNNLKLLKLSSINKVSSYSDTGSRRDDPYWTSRKIVQDWNWAFRKMFRIYRVMQYKKS